MTLAHIYLTGPLPTVENSGPACTMCKPTVCMVVVHKSRVLK